MDFIAPELDQYACLHSDEESELLKRINRETHLKVLTPRMLSGHLQGRVLAMLSHMIKPRRILEIGTYTGYSALCIAEGMTADGKIITIDINAELEERVRGYFAESPYSGKIDFRVGNAVDLIPGIEEKFDLVFIDADKINYPAYFDLVMDKLNTGGFIIADNVLWSGKVLMEEELMDKDTKAIHEFNSKVQNDSRVENVLFPIRDGLMIVRKK
ncbi:MAG TPA: methyltransferase [Flavobacteriales bacterium]|nr:methyltransferase [Flavobacteriales bacterium]HRE74589.1 O-methyltransferase [Flavobacteriales bacterium]HRE98065.1 O-methyltransferase [Flavobacteriales bacterium]HRJ36067.1 O-methyltransferase [Flavobacteriales bacterium]HRJ39925.1 O-methyltransferase [Flavobacteriales bacterium]